MVNSESNDHFDSLIHIARERALTELEAEDAMRMMADGIPAASSIRDFLTTPALAVDEVAASTLVGLARVVRSRAIGPTLPAGIPRIDTCGTGGGMATFNISTAAALLLAALSNESTRDFFVCKHGNRAVASKSGSADVLERLGVAIELGPDANARLLEETGFAFFFAPKYHSVFSHVGPVRRDLAASGVRTAFNLIGPLANPVAATHQVVGICSISRLRVMAEAFTALGTTAAFCVSGRAENGGVFDEIIPSGEAHGFLLRDGEITERVLTPEEMGLRRFSVDDLAAADAEESASLIRSVLSGTAAGTAPEAAVVMNAVALLHLFSGETPQADADRCRRFLASGAALRHLNRIASRSQSLAT